jgi:hypothetical protein
MRKTLLACVLLFSHQLLFAQDPTWFKDITIKSGLAGEKMQKAYVVDVNNDGFQDIITITGVDYFNNRKPLKLFLNTPDDINGGRTFKDKTEWSRLNSNVQKSDTGRQTTCAAFADVDNDGDVDMVTAHYFIESKTTKMWETDVKCC